MAFPGLIDAGKAVSAAAVTVRANRLPLLAALLGALMLSQGGAANAQTGPEGPEDSAFGQARVQEVVVIGA